MQQATEPKLWKVANVVMAPKDTSIYTSIIKYLQPILVTPTLNKILESFIGKWRLEKYKTSLTVARDVQQPTSW